ncbi:MAG: AAA family ATPase, partial [Candidatus Sericytochromatia bacterium]
MTEISRREDQDQAARASQDQLLFEGSHSLIRLAELPDYPNPVILKILKKAHPSLQEIAQFNNEFEFTHAVKVSGIRKAHRKTQYHHQSALILEYIAGQTLKQHRAARPFSLAEVLGLAIKIAQILGEIHQLGMVHKDINPANILIEASSGQPWVIDFGLACKWEMKVSHLNQPQHLEGTLAYLSPEQTGRMHRLVDYRSDLYSLGVSLYEILTGRLPFDAQDSIGWVHAHIASPPRPAAEINSQIPETLSRIVAKLMAKNAEDRYQSAFGLKKDLEKILHQAPAFELGAEDYSARLQIPQKLFGREQETQSLMAAFERICQGGFELMLIAGYSGVGKTALVYQLHKPITEKYGCFISGKFDQFQRNIPYAVFTQAFTQLCEYLLTESESQLERWRQRILAAVGNNGQVLLDIIPKLEWIIGAQPEIPVLAPKEAQNRFNLYFGYFIEAICTAEHPLVIFIDDLQWADLASLELLKLLFSEAHHYLLLVGAYRDNEVTPRHPMLLTVAEIESLGHRINQLHLDNLSREHLAGLLQATLADPQQLGELLDLTYEKTLGNAFFVTQFLRSLNEEHLLAFDFEARKWRWDMAVIQGKDITDNVITFMSNKIKKLPQTTQEVLKLAACIGNRFELSLLTALAECPVPETARAVQDCLIEGLIAPMQEIHQLRVLVMAGQVSEIEKYAFIHDRVQQAAYALIAEAARQSLHLKIGYLLWQSSQDKFLEERLFDIIEHLHLGLGLVHDQAERIQIARLSLQAGQRAKLSAAYESAFKYLKTGLTCLPAAAWEQAYDLTLELYVEAIECAYVSGNFAEMAAWSDEVLEQVTDLLDAIKVYEVRISAHLAQYQLKEALTSGLETLQALGISIPVEPGLADLQSGLGEALQRIAGTSPAELMALPEIADPRMLAGMHLMVYMNLPAYFFRPLLYPVMVAKEIGLIAQYGNVPESPFIYATFAMILCGVVDDIELGYQFGQISRQLLAHDQARPVEGRTLFVLGNGVLHWKQSIRDYLGIYLESYRKGLETGDLEFAGQAVHSYCFNLYFIGMELSQVAKEMRHYERVLVKLKVSTALNYLQIYHQAVLNLSTSVADPLCLQGAVYAESEMIAVHTAANDRTAMFVLYFCKMQLAYLFGDFAQASDFAARAAEYLDAAIALTHGPIFHGFDSLIRLALCAGLDAAQRAEQLEVVTANQLKLKRWAELGPGNYLQKYLLVEAEKARVLGQSELAMATYARAIATAQQNRYLNDEALANECYGKFWLAKDQPKIAALYF